MKILGVKIDPVDYQETIEKIGEFIVSQNPHHLVTLNPEMIVTAQKDREFKRILNDSDLNTPDGFGIRLALKKIHHLSLQENVTGVDLTYKLADISQTKKWKIYLVGAGRGIAQKTAKNLLKKYPKARIVGATQEPDLDDIKKKKPDIFLLAFGPPKQEKWIYEHKNELKIPVTIGVGGTFDYISGKIKRAPKWMRTLGLEWLYRLIQQPSRAPRIFNAVVKFPLLVLFSKK